VSGLTAKLEVIAAQQVALQRMVAAVRQNLDMLTAQQQQ